MPSAYVDMQLIKTNKTQQKHQAPCPNTKPQNNTQKQNQNQLPQLGQVTGLVYCVAAETADLAECENGNKQLSLAT